MATSAWAKMLGSLPSDLVASAVDLSERAGTHEYCFPFRDAGVVLESLLGSGWVVLGGDLWLVEGDEYFSVGEGWYVDSVDQESFDAHERRSPSETPVSKTYTVK